MNSANPKLSIIIPCYNCERTLRQAVDSCYEQGFNESEFEIVMVDDGSKDNTRKLMQELASKHANIQVHFHEKNQGGGATRNTAVSYSKGAVLFGLDSDDMLPPNTLLKMYNFLQEKGCDGTTIYRSIKFSEGTVSDPNKKDPEQKQAQKPVRKIEHIDISPFFSESQNKCMTLNSLFEKNIEFCPVYVTFMYTKKAFDKTGGFPITHGYDTQGFGWRFLCAGLTVYTCPDAEYLHRIYAGESYFLREFNAGKMNYNWRDILLEHFEVFTKETQDFILSFDCSDFTQNIMDELIDRGNVLLPDIENVLKNEQLMSTLKLEARKRLMGISPDRKFIHRNSLLGYYLRIKNRLLETQTANKTTIMKNLIKLIFKKLPFSDKSRKFIRRTMNPSWLYFIKNNTHPLSDCYGFDRGTPLDRHYIEKFLEDNKADVRGACLELLNNDYTLRYGGSNVIKSDVLDIDPANKNATIIDDLRKLGKVSDNTYDCIMLTQVFQFIDNCDAAVAECYRVLKPGGVLLATLPSVSRIDCMSGVNGDYWRFTSAGAKYLFEKKFVSENTSISSVGNARSGIYFYAGMTIEETPLKTLKTDDPQFPLIITVRAVK